MCMHVFSHDLICSCWLFKEVSAQYMCMFMPICDLICLCCSLECQHSTCVCTCISSLDLIGCMVVPGSVSLVHVCVCLDPWPHLLYGCSEKCHHNTCVCTSPPLTSFAVLLFQEVSAEPQRAEQRHHWHPVYWHAEKVGVPQPRQDSRSVKCLAEGT